jgi:uncharacterized membrane protein
MCDGSLTSMLPALTVAQFGITRGPEVYSVMYSAFGVASMLGLFFMLTIKDIIGFAGMFVISFCFVSLAAFMNFKLEENKPYDYGDKKELK